MIALQILLLSSAVCGLWVSRLNFQRANQQYEILRKGGSNGLSLQVASHHVRIAVTNVVIEASALIVAVVVLGIMWIRKYQTGIEWADQACGDLGLVMFTGLVVASILNMLKQLMYLYDRALIMDVAVVTDNKALNKVDVVTPQP